jgi:two-component system response regulator FixJ
MPNEPLTIASVCLVDDDTDVLKATTRLLASGGFAVQPFNAPNDFLEYAKTHSIPVVILDIWMKEMSGLEVQSKLSRISPRTRVIVITGRNDPGVQRTATQFGAVAFFIKPYDDEMFLAAVRNALADSTESAS